jgi:predicted GNAT family acetyltransferase
MSTTVPTIADNPKLSRYEMIVNGEVAFLSYRRKPDNILLSHTEVPEVFRGRGYGTLLAKHALDEARREGKQVIVKCPFVTTWLKRHHEYDDIIIARVADTGEIKRQPREPK